jgi:hypothetical protein
MVQPTSKSVVTTLPTHRTHVTTPKQNTHQKKTNCINAGCINPIGAAAAATTNNGQRIAWAAYYYTIALLISYQ